MGSKVKVKLNSAGVKALLKSSEVEALCFDVMRTVQSNAGENYAVETRRYPERTGAAVYPANEQGYYDNLNNNTLLKVFKK